MVNAALTKAAVQPELNAALTIKVAVKPGLIAVVNFAVSLGISAAVANGAAKVPTGAVHTKAPAGPLPLSPPLLPPPPLDLGWLIHQLPQQY